MADAAQQITTDDSVKFPNYKGLKTSSDVFSEEAKLVPEISKSQADIERAQQSQDLAALKFKTEAQRKYSSDIKEAQLKADREKLPAPEFHPTQDNAESLGALFSLVATAGILAGSSGKIAANNAMNAMTGMLKGWQQGRQDLFKREKDMFDKEFARIKSVNDQIQQHLQNALQSAATDRDTAMLESELAARIAGGDSIIAAKVKNGDLVGALQLTQSFGKVVAKTEQIKAQAREKALDRQSQREFMKDMLIERNIEKIDPEIRFEVQKHYPDSNINSLVGMNPKTSERIIGNIDTIKNLESIADYIAKNPKAVGATAKIKNFINLDAIHSVTGDSKEDADKKAAILEQQIDEAVRRKILTADEAASAKILNKMLFSAALSDIKSSGQRGSVYLDKQFQTIYDQASKPATLIGIISKRIEDSNRNLEFVNLDIGKRNDPESFPLATGGADKWINEHFPTYTPEQVRKLRTEGTLKSGDYFTRTDGLIGQVK